MPNAPQDTNDDGPGTAPTAPSGAAPAAGNPNVEEMMGNMMLGREATPPQDGGEEAEQSGEGETQQTESVRQPTLQVVFNQAITGFKKVNDKFAEAYSTVLATHTGSAQVSENVVLKADKASGGMKRRFRCTLLFEATSRGAPTDPVLAPVPAPLPAAVAAPIPPPLPTSVATAVATADPALTEELPDADPPQPPVRERPLRADRRDRDEQPALAPSAPWAKYNLALTGLCALLLLGVLVAVLASKPAQPAAGPQLPSTLADDIAGKVKASVPQQRDYTGPAKGDVTKLDASITALNTSVDTLSAKVEESLKAGAGGGVPPKDVTDAIAAFKKDLGALAKKVEEGLKPGTGGGVPPKDVTDAIAAFNKELTGLTKKIDDKLKLPGGGATPADVSNALNAVKADVNKALDVFKTELGNVAKKQGATPTDVVVVVAHGRAMNANDYRPALSGALVNPPHGRDKDSLAKVGLVVAVTAQPNVVVAPDAPQAKVDDLGAPNPQASEEPARLGEQFAEKKELQSGRLKRYVLVVSAGCQPLGPNAAGWKDFKEVHVVLVAREKGDAEKAELVRWHEFAAARGGTVSVVGHGDAATQNRVLGERLKLLSHPLN